MVKRLTQPVPSLRTARPNVSEGVDQAVHRALAPIAADRFATATEFADALARTAPAVDPPMVATRRARNADATTRPLAA